MSLPTTNLLNTHGLEGIAGARIAIVGTEWNEPIITALRKGCADVAAALDAVISHDITVPGAVELPFTCKRLFETSEPRGDGPEAIIALGAVIRGGTPHFDYVCKSVTEGLTRLNLFLPIPVIFGVLTLDNEAQAWERLGGPHGHKGEEAMMAALKMIALNRKLAGMG